jgi:glycosyltransferase involved in cell wall biosynthesis
MGDITFWLSVALVCYAYVGYPGALMAIGLFRTRPVRQAVMTPRVSFVIAARNEEGRMAQKLKNTVEQDYPPEALEIIVASDCSTDATDAIVRAYSERVRLVRASERRGKEAAQRLALQEASGEILVFSDVATALAPDAVSTIVRNFADPTVGCVSSVDRFVDADGRVSGEGAYVRYEMFLRSLESEVNTLVGLSGSFFAARREVCQHWPVDRTSDFNTLLNAVQVGLRGVLDPQSAGYYRNIADERQEFGRKVRTVARGIAVLIANRRMLNPFLCGLFSWQLASHKLCRWLVPFAMIGAAVSNAFLVTQSSFYATTFVLQGLFYAAAVVGLSTGNRVLRIPAYFVLSNVAVLIAWFRFVRGDRITTWTPSARTKTLPEVSSHLASRV